MGVLIALRTDLARYVNTTSPAPQWVVADGILTRACQHEIDAGGLTSADAAEIIRGVVGPLVPPRGI